MAALIFLLKSILVAAVLFAYYWLVLRPHRIHRFNRFFLLGITVISLAVPFLHATMPAGFRAAGHPLRIPSFIPLTDTEAQPSGVVDAGNSMGYIGLLLYAVVSLVLLYRSSMQVLRVMRIRNAGRRSLKDGICMVHTDAPGTPFSFLNNLFWNSRLSTESLEGQRIWLHEQAHIRQHHSLDKLWLQFLVSVCWLHPVFWLIRRELALQHEFLADEAAIEAGDTDGFARMLLTARHPGLQPDLVHSFFHSSTKRRLVMITQPIRTPFRRLRMLAALPVLGLLATALAFESPHTVGAHAPHKITLMLDAGHGGKDAGASGANGLSEKQLNAIIVSKLREMAPSYGIEAMVTRTGDETLSLPDRVKKVNASGADVLLSVHVNKSAGHVPFQPYLVITGTADASVKKAAPLASAISAQLEDLHIHAPVSKGELRILRDSRIPAVTLECGDINNAEHMAQLMNDDRLQALCDKILTGVVNYDNYLHGHR